MTNHDIEQMVAAGDRGGLLRLRNELVQRLHERSDDHEASAQLMAANKALAEVGWESPYDWRHRRKP
jgi:3-oxoacyl-[acyl-carrier-protein] synthase III